MDVGTTMSTFLGKGVQYFDSLPLMLLFMHWLVMCSALEKRSCPLCLVSHVVKNYIVRQFALCSRLARLSLGVIL